MGIREYTRIYSILCVLVASVFSCAWADTLYLKNGHMLDGMVKNEDPQSIIFEVSGGCVIFKRSEVARVEKSSAEDSYAMQLEWHRQKALLQNKIAKKKHEDLSRPREIEVINKGQGMLLKVKLNRKVEATLILDTGASMVLISRNVADALGLKFGKLEPDTKMKLADGRQVEAVRVVLESVAVEGYEAHNVEAAVPLGEAANIDFADGLLGMSFLRNFKFTVDQKNNKLLLEKLY